MANHGDIIRGLATARMNVRKRSVPSLPKKANPKAVAAVRKRGAPRVGRT